MSEWHVIPVQSGPFLMNQGERKLPFANVQDDDKTIQDNFM